MKRDVSPEPGAVSDADAIATFSASKIAMVLTNPRLEDNPIVYVNEAFERLTGYTREMAIGRNCRFLQGEKTDGSHVERIRDAVTERTDIATEILNYRADGTPFRNVLVVTPVRGIDGEEVQFFLGLQREASDFDDRSRETQLSGLIDEIQHRVKNHLSMVLMLLRTTGRASSARKDFEDISRRVESLQLLYEELSFNPDGRNEDRIQLGAYLGRVANAIGHLDGRAGVRMNIDVAPVLIETDTAVRIGLIVSEILTNAMQHAFEGQSSGLVELRVTETDAGGIRAMVTDDGVGIPSDVNWPSGGGLGARLVSGLCDGLGASLSVVPGAVGTVITLEVPQARNR